MTKRLLAVLILTLAGVLHAQEMYTVVIPHSATRFRSTVEDALRTHKHVRVKFEPGTYHIVRPIDLRGVTEVDATDCSFEVETQVVFMIDEPMRSITGGYYEAQNSGIFHLARHYREELKAGTHD